MRFVVALQRMLRIRRFTQRHAVIELLCQHLDDVPIAVEVDLEEDLILVHAPKGLRPKAIDHQTVDQLRPNSVLVEGSRNRSVPERLEGNLILAHDPVPEDLPRGLQGLLHVLILDLQRKDHHHQSILVVHPHRITPERVVEDVGVRRSIALLVGLGGMLQRLHLQYLAQICGHMPPEHRIRLHEEAAGDAHIRLARCVPKWQVRRPGSQQQAVCMRR
mmetsp:Transcript_181749/g.576715  ORF Transcript_181749/g.576715 Transcript_181749/m.576715 type:complete len:218 (-) Transcript_181749:19-672(-)